ncbi:MAG: diguanylate cyclase [Lysobacterales bacterium]
MPSDHLQRQAQLDNLRLRYVGKLPQRVARLREGWLECAQRAQPQDQLRSLRFMAHGLAGSASTFGYVALGACALQLEIKLQKALDQGTLDDPHRSAVAALVDEVVKLGLSPPDGAPAKSLPAAVEAESSDPNRVFVIGDNHLSAQEMALRLGDFGYFAKVFGDWSAARTAMSSRKPLAILLDTDRCKKSVAEDPLQLARHLAADGLDVPIIMLSEYEGWRERLCALRAGATAYFGKPIDYPALVETLDRMTGRSRAAPFRILVLEDVEELSQHHAEVLRGAGMEVRAFTDPFEALDQLAEFKPDLLLMDLYMPECSGTELSALIRQKPNYDSLPIIFLSVENRLDDHLQALRVGGDEFLLKPIRADHLIAAVSNRAARFRTLSELMRTDGLTGLLTQITTRLQLEELLPLALRRNSPLCFAMLDLDNFKQVNDQYGHPAGDRVLRMLARQLRQSLRRTDIIGRYGGEEFAVILPDTPLKEAARIIDELRERFAGLAQQHGAHSFRVTFSGGVACSEQRAQMDELIGAADHALYQAKRAGRNQICTFVPPLQPGEHTDAGEPQRDQTDTGAAPASG